MKRRRHQRIFKEDGFNLSQCNTLLKKKKKNSTTIRRVNSDSLPIDLIIEILWRLPTKSIAICRCVSKLWASTLRLSCFTELFLTRSSSCPQLFFSCDKIRDSSSLHFFSAPQQVQNKSLVTASYHMKFPYIDSYNNIGSFDHLRGLTCYTNLKILIGQKNNEMVSVICNPSTRESLHLPMLKTRNKLVKSFLGYDPIGKQFKVLSLTWTHYKRHELFEDRQVLTLGTKNSQWRKIECCVPHYALGKGICINGVLYYHPTLVNGISSRDDPKIVWFDVRYEKFRFINGPDVTWLSYSTLVNYRGKLGVTCSNSCIRRQTTSFEFWVLVDAEKHEWSKHVYVLPSLWKNVVSENDVLKIVGVIAGTNEIVLVSQYRYYDDRFYVYYYDFENETIRRVGIEGIVALTKVQPYPKVETFLDHLEDVKLLKMF